jgi:hypothetical protein
MAAESFKFCKLNSVNNPIMDNRELVLSLAVVGTCCILLNCLPVVFPVQDESLLSTTDRETGVFLHKYLTAIVKLRVKSAIAQIKNFPCWDIPPQLFMSYTEGYPHRAKVIRIFLQE